jgi:hypothetical protein
MWTLTEFQNKISAFFSAEYTFLFEFFHSYPFTEFFFDEKCVGVKSLPIWRKTMINEKILSWQYILWDNLHNVNKPNSMQK